jgi:RING finger protein 113A
LLEKNILLNAGKDGTKVGDGIYRGMAAQKSFVRKDIAQVGGNKQTGTQGPLRAPTFLRAGTTFSIHKTLIYIAHSNPLSFMCSFTV